MTITKQAAGVLIVQDGNILAFERSDGRGYGLLCGDVDPNEPIALAACREAREEGGVLVELERRPHTAINDTGRKVTIYLANIIGCVPITHPEEGTPTWVTPEFLLANTPWPINMRNILEHFGVI